METTETPVQNEEISEKTTPVKEVKQNGQDGESTAESSGPTEENVEKKEEIEEAVDNHQEEEERKGEDEADKDEKTKEKTEKAGDDESDELSSDDEPQKGSLDGPVEIMTGKRERKKVERLSMQSPPEKEKEKFEIKEGRGIKLGDCPMVEFQLNKTNADVLKPLYRVLFGRTGKVNEIKRHIRKFSGFTFTKEDKTEYEKKEVQLNRFTTGGLKELCMWLNLEKGGTKEDLIQRIFEYCLNPVMSKKKPPVKRKKGSKKTGKKRKKVDGKGDSKKRKKSSKKKSGDDTVEDEDEGDAIDDEEDNDDDDAAGDDLEDEDSEVEEPKPKKAKKQTPKPVKKTKAKTTPKKTSPKKSSAKRSAAKIEDSDDESSDDDAPLSKKSKSPPSDSEMKTVIKKFLDGANLEQVTMKTVCKKVYEMYPEFDLTHKKDFIKSTVKQIIST
ncbi:protein DEK-like isoform X1 [Apostichopus japonicus]|uniref:protein DEK-like isoform X1 n=1 Tax=Stichopus japonicus TaxID=307972 RepID=UPI003AB4A5FD